MKNGLIVGLGIQVSITPSQGERKNCSPKRFLALRKSKVKGEKIVFFLDFRTIFYLSEKNWFFVRLHASKQSVFCLKTLYFQWGSKWILISPYLSHFSVRANIFRFSDNSDFGIFHTILIVPPLSHPQRSSLLKTDVIFFSHFLLSTVSKTWGFMLVLLLTWLGNFSSV